MTGPRVTQPAIATATQFNDGRRGEATAHQFFNSYSNGQYAFAWALLDRSTSGRYRRPPG